MNIRIVILCLLCIITSPLYAQEDTPQEENTVANISFTKKKKRASNRKKNFPFQFENKDLVDVINLISAEKGVNIVLPQKPPIDAKLSFYVPEKVTIDEAWNLLYTLLDLAGYAIKPQGDMFAVIRIPDAPGSLASEPMPTFIGTPFDELPDGDIRIRYVHYLANMKVPAPGTNTQDNELSVVLNHILAGGAAPASPNTTTFVTDANANAVIFVGKADTIKGAMAVIKQLDKGGFHEKMEIVKLKHTNASDVKRLFIENLLKAAPPATPHMRGDTRKPGETYFAPNTRIIDEPRTNSLIVVGRAQAVDRIKDFIETYLDIEPDSGKSILHVYTLLYLDAQQLVPVLERVIGLKDASGTGQSRADGKPVGGPERFFDTVIIKSDKPDSAQNVDDKSGSKYQYSGGNRLIIAARNDDWKRIKALLEQLDKPFPQVFIEVLIADVSIDDIRQLGAQTRNLHGCMPSHINIQAAELNIPVIDTTVPPGTIAGDLLANTIPATDSSGAVIGTTNLAALASPGSALISFNDKDGQTWSLLQLLRSFNATKIISHPHVVCINNKPASISIGETRLVLGEAALGTQAANIKQDPIKALLQVSLTPRISADNVINLNVDISINTFAANTPGFKNTINTREVHTNANIRNKSILALGGLISTEEDDAETETPLLSKIPILGWFFKNRSNNTNRENLTVFISPTVIMPNLRGGVHQHAKDYIGLAKQYAAEGSLFDSLRDPVTRFFFRTDVVEAARAMDEFIKDDETLNGSMVRAKAPGRKLQKRERRVKALAAKQENRTLKDVVQVHEANPLLASSRGKKIISAPVA